MFIQIFENHPKTAVAGPYFSCYDNIQSFTSPHIQSFMMAVDKRGLFFMKKIFRCQKLNETKFSWICHTEIVCIYLLFYFEAENRRQSLYNLVLF